MDDRTMERDLLERASWAWGLSLILLTIALHATGVVIMGVVGQRIRLALEHRRLDARQAIPIVIAIVGTVGVILAALHGMEALVWAAAYVFLGAFGSFADALLYSVGTMTTAGAPGLFLPFRWQMMGALESVNGMLLFGISTAYIFSVMQVYWPMLSSRGIPGHPRPGSPPRLETKQPEIRE
jgi:hypothetical protein